MQLLQRKTGKRVCLPSLERDPLSLRMSNDLDEDEDEDEDDFSTNKD